jgi:hypothetical protein
MQAIVSLSRAVAMAKSSELSLPLSARFNRFVDTDASVLSAVFSSCGVDAMLTKYQALFFVLFVSFIVANLGIFVSDILDLPFLSISPVANPLFWFFLSAALFVLGSWPIIFGGSIFSVPSTEFKPRKIAAVAFFLYPCISSAIIVYIKAVHFGSISFTHSIICDAAQQKQVLAVSYNACYLYEICAIYPVQCISLCTVAVLIYAKQELALRGVILSVIAIMSVFFGFIEMVKFENLLPLRFICGAVIVFASLILVVFESLNLFSMRQAARTLKDDETLYTEKWNNLMNHTNDGLSAAAQLSECIGKRFGKAVDGANRGIGWFSRRVHVLQEHSSVDNLFDDVELVDAAFQGLVRCWLMVR